MKKKPVTKKCQDCERFNTDKCRNQWNKSCWKPDAEMTHYIMNEER